MENAGCGVWIAIIIVDILLFAWWFPLGLIFLGLVLFA